MTTAFWLTNALLETGYQTFQGRITGTATDLFNLLIEDGKVSQVVPAADSLTDDLPQTDAGGLLLIPSFIEKHCHLDKTLLGDQWRSVTLVDSIFERFDIEKNVLSSLETTTQTRAEKLLNCYASSGVTHVRSHVDIYPEAGLTNLEEVQKALETYEGQLSSELVAFPQHGLLRSGAQDLVRDALRNGADYVGGVDPAMVDGDIETSLQTTVELAATENAGIDLHLHDAGHLGIFTMQRLAQLTKEAGLQGNVSVSHAFGLGDIPVSQAAEMAEQLQEAGIAIISNVPIDGRFPPLPLLAGRGVNVALGCDNIFDVWSPFGNGDVLERANRLAEVSQWVDERSLSQTLSFITGGKTPLNEAGEQVWPHIGDEASFTFADATCSAEVVARRRERLVTMFQGNVISGSF
ncbi:amidohydrolase family protein [Barrientosiimonas marina]|uniref:Amidohydrolase n=1 Tax=Lentibacillus kimchii TaxID=1542911 RepID=A0ABW2UUQ1_9BACI